MQEPVGVIELAGLCAILLWFYGMVSLVLDYNIRMNGPTSNETPVENEDVCDD